MKILLHPSASPKGFGLGLADIEGHIYLYALSPCCSSQVTWTYVSGSYNSCNNCSERVTGGYSDSRISVSASDEYKSTWASTWTGLDLTVKVEENA